MDDVDADELRAATHQLEQALARADAALAQMAEGGGGDASLRRVLAADVERMRSELHRLCREGADRFGDRLKC